MLKILKIIAIFFASALALIVGLIAFSYYFQPTYEADFQLPKTHSHIILQLLPMHPYLAEYKRSIVLRKDGLPDQELELFPDTGGYRRTQVYQSGDGQFMVKGYFDAAGIDTKDHKLFLYQTATIESSIYLGAFDDSFEGKWRFLPASQSAEQTMQAGGVN